RGGPGPPGADAAVLRGGLPLPAQRRPRPARRRRPDPGVRPPLHPRPLPPRRPPPRPVPRLRQDRPVPPGGGPPPPPGEGTPAGVPGGTGAGRPPARPGRGRPRLRAELAGGAPLPRLEGPVGRRAGLGPAVLHRPPLPGGEPRPALGPDGRGTERPPGKAAD